MHAGQLLQFVQRALKSKAAGDDSAYRELVDTIKSGGEGKIAGPCQLPLITSLSKCTATLTKKAHHSVVSAVLANCWR